MRKIKHNKVQNTLKRVSNKGMKSLENNFSVKATKNMVNTPKIVIEKSPIVAKPNVVTSSSKIASKPEKVRKPKIVDKPKIFIEKNLNYDEYKNRVIKQLKKHFKKLFDARKSNYLDDDDDECNGIKDLEYLFEDYYEPKEIKSAFDGSYILCESKGDKHAKLSIAEYFDKIKPYLKDMIDDHKARGEWKIQLVMRIIFVSFIDGK